MTCFTRHKLTTAAALFGRCGYFRRERRMIRTRWMSTLAAAAGIWILAGTTSAATWDGGGGDGNWTTAANWVGDVAPVAGDLLQFGGTTNLLTNNDFAVGTLFNGIDFLAGAGSFTLGGNGILLGGDINNNSGVAQTINFAAVPVTVNGAHVPAGGLVLDGATSNVNVSAGGSLSLGQVTFGAAPQSTNVSTLNINNSVAASGLTVQTNSAGTNTINIATGQTFTVNGNVFLGTPSTVDRLRATSQPMSRSPAAATSSPAAGTSSSASAARTSAAATATSRALT